ncbi:HD domain-containing protein [Hoeflea sp. 108]|uniref:HD domain-containing protein n=1 Tax=Hoeflea sp. 108 TaxID=1116369 RepID=UPI00037D0E28|nr:HD domain-containing protein [Hoeflea sp. 108]
MSKLETAICLAARIHEGQLDKNGDPYILHPLRVMLAQDDELSRIVGVLHDVVEKSDLTLGDLVVQGFQDEVIGAVDCMTRRRNEDYFDFVKRAASNALALPVKLADLRDNLRASSADGDAERRDRYEKALALLGCRS